MTGQREAPGAWDTGGEKLRRDENAPGTTPSADAIIPQTDPPEISKACAISILDARRFLELIAPGAAMRRFAFQTFDDSKDRKDKSLACTLWGTFDDVAEDLANFNRRGAGVFVAPNEFAPDASRRINDEVIATRCCWADLDGAPLDPVLSGPVVPHVVTETSPGRYHAFWRGRELCPLDNNQWRAVQKGIARQFDGDASMDKPCGVVRLPGFYHQKAEPFRVRIAKRIEGRGYYYDLLDAFAPDFSAEDKERRFAEPVVGAIGNGERNVKLTKIAGKVRDFGCSERGILAMLREENAQRCAPPLSDDELRGIVKSVMRYPVGRAWYAVDDAESAVMEQWSQATSEAWARLVGEA